VAVNEVHDAAGTSYDGYQAGQQLASMWDYSRIGADWANNNGWTGKGMKVAVIDTGVDRYNPYLSGRVANEACFATYTNGTGACAGGQKSIYSTTAAGGVVGAAAPCTYNTGTCSHGTHTAHTAAGMYGTARGASIIAIQASHQEWDATTSSYVSRFNDIDEMNALWYVQSVLPKLNIVAASVNMSIGGGGSTGYCDSTSTNSITYWINQLLTSYQIPVVISSGNDNYSNMVSSPACNSNAISVGNTTLSGNLDAVYGNISNGSNSNATLDLLAPGTDICSAVPTSLDVNDNAKDGWACGWIGTSMAAPHVAGALAILTQKRPTATVAQLLAALQRSGSTGGVAVTDSRNNITRTRIRVDNAVYYF
jgi:subtilisin family serine protease